MSFIKHIGKVQDKKVAIIYRVVPGEEHMALVCYPDLLPKHFNDSIMGVIESDAGQQAENLADALHRNLFKDGRQILTTLHKEGMIKKVATKDIVVTPNATSHVHLDELNKIMDGISTGDNAAKKMKDLDDRSGLVDPAVNRKAQQENVDLTNMSNEGIAKQRLDQSKKLILEAKAMNLEAKRLKEEAYELDATLKPKPRIVKKTTKKAVKKVVKKVVKKAVKKVGVKKKAQ